jgi:hypothetical protein
MALVNHFSVRNFLEVDGDVKRLLEKRKFLVDLCVYFAFWGTFAVVESKF